MATYRYPVLVWPDAAGAATAVLLGDVDPAAARAATVEGALRQLKELLEWRLEHEPWNVDPDFSEPELVEVKVDVRPQYRQGRRLIPCPDTVPLRIPCVLGRQQSGLRLCVLPHCGTSFNLQDAATLRSLVSHYVLEDLQSVSPLGLAGRLPPRDCTLHEIVLRDTRRAGRRPAPPDDPELRVLFTVADPLLLDLGRKRASSAAFGRETLALTLVRKLGQQNANVLLVGETGVGKSTLLLDAVKRLSREGKEPEQGEEEERAHLRSYRFWRGSAGRLIAGMRYLGEWEERCEEFIRRLAGLGGIWCVENLLELVQVGGEGPGDSVAAFVLPYAQRGELRLVAEATPAEVEACRRLLPGLLDVFQLVHVPVFAEGEAVQVLTRILQARAANAKVEVAPTVVTLVHRLFKRFLPYVSFPGAAAGFVRQLCDGRDSGTAASRKAITPQDVVELFIQRTGLPEIFLRDELPLAFRDVQAQFAQDIIGQPEATTAAAQLVTRIKAGLTDHGRPSGVLLFCGPTGVGKTALARRLASFCFGSAADTERLVRLDMSEYSGWDAARRLLRDAQGQPASWIEAVRRRPFCVVLLDEIEKAAPEVFDILLGVLDEGRLTDPFGRVTHFRSAILIMTSNLGSTATASAGFAAQPGPSTGSGQAPGYASAVGKFFRPEFFNRLDGVIAFRPLTLADIENITRKELGELAAREGFAAARIALNWSERLVTLVARRGYDHRFGARPLQRTLERLVVMPLARWRVAHPMARDQLLRLDVGPEETVSIHAAPANSPVGRERGWG